MGDPFVRRCRSNRICRENGSLPHLESRNRGNYSAGSGTGKGVLGSRQIIFIEKKMQMPAVMVDLDLIIWKDIRNIIKDTDICAIHREGIFPDVYPGKEFFHMKQEYRFDPDWSFEVLPVNTCMLYIADEAFKNYYVDSSITFMENCLETEENLCHMVFAEQRLLAMCAEKQGKQISSFFPVRHRSRTRISSHIYGAIRTF